MKAPERKERWTKRFLTTLADILAFAVGVMAVILFGFLAEVWPVGIAIVFAAGVLGGAIVASAAMLQRRKPPKIYNLTVSQTDPILLDILEMLREAQKKDAGR